MKINVLRQKIKNKKFNNTIKRGNILLIKYLMLKEDEIKTMSFIGLCIARIKQNNAIVLKNTIKKEKIKLMIYGHSPLIVSIKIIKKFKKKFRLSKLYYK
jgi:ribosomal protein L19